MLSRIPPPTATRSSWATRLARSHQGRHRRGVSAAEVTGSTDDAPAPYLFVAVVGRTMVLRGELDLRSGISVAAAGRTMIACCRETGREGTLDGGGLTFVDAGGVGALVELGRALRSAGSRLTTPTASPSLRRVCDICGLGGALGLGHEADNAAPSAEPSAPHLRAVPRP